MAALTFELSLPDRGPQPAFHQFTKTMINYEEVTPMARTVA